MTLVSKQEAGQETRFLTLEEFGREVRLHKSRVAELASSGAVPTVNVGRRYLVSRRWLDELEQAAIQRASGGAHVSV